MKIGVYGGTFNPPHLGHVTAARAVFELLKLDRLLLVRLYPEQGSEVRLPQLRGGGKLYLCCSRHGLFEVKLP